MTDAARPIGVFDSGVGGLTVLRALRERLPSERFLYLGDTARVPYGTKSADTVRTYALNAAGLLIERGVKCLVIACNSASAAAMPALAARWPAVPIVGVIEPGAIEAARALGGGRGGSRAGGAGSGVALVLATENTAASGAYQRAIRAHAPGASVVALPATLLVALAEEGWTSGPLVESIVREVLGPALERRPPACALLGCTHFPVLAGVIGDVLGRGVPIIDSARTTADAAACVLGRAGLIAHETGAGGGADYLATDGPERFARISGRFLETPIDASDVELVDIV